MPQKSAFFAKADASDEEIENACRIANIHDFIVSQPDGYDTQVGNRGLKLSGGEKQRLSIARVILKDPKILILDEATSALDEPREQEMYELLKRELPAASIVSVGHRSTLFALHDTELHLEGEGRWAVHAIG